MLNELMSNQLIDEKILATKNFLSIPYEPLVPDYNVPPTQRQQERISKHARKNFETYCWKFLNTVSFFFLLNFTSIFIWVKKNLIY